MIPRNPVTYGAGEGVTSLPLLLRALAGARRAGRRIVFTNGVFDLLHVGHVRYLAAARRQGDILVVGVNSDASVRRFKGPRRPIVPQAERAEMLAALAPVNHVVVFGDNTPERLIRAIRPDVLVKGADWARGAIVGGQFVESLGGRVVRIRLARGRSTTNLVRRVLKLYRE